MPAAASEATNRPAAVIVEGDDALRRLMTVVLERSGLTVYSVAGEKGLVTYLQERGDDAVPLVLIADLDQPGGVGLTTLKLLRRRHPDLPMVMITALGDAGGIGRARVVVGDVQVLEKPFDVLELRRIVVEQLNVYADLRGSTETADNDNTQGAA